MPPQQCRWIKFFRDKAQEYKTLSDVKRTAHAEIQLSCYLETMTGSLAGQVFPYLGCSKKCCFFCEQFRLVHGAFLARGTHETIFPFWALPQALNGSTQSVPLLRQFSGFLNILLRAILNLPYPLSRQDLLQQSSAALSTAQAAQQEQAVYSARPAMVTCACMRHNPAVTMALILR